MSLQYSGSLDTDGCSSGACNTALSAASSLDQGRTFATMTAKYHGGRRSRKASRKMNRKSRRASRRMNRRSRRASRRMNRRAQRGGMADYPSQFSTLLPSDMHAAADVTKLDNAFAQLPAFAGKYGMSGGARKRTARARRGGGFGYTPGPSTGSAMILSPSEEPQAFLNPQWYTENQVVPSFVGPANGLVQKAGKRRSSRKHRKAHRKGRKASRRSCRK